MMTLPRLIAVAALATAVTAGSPTIPGFLDEVVGVYAANADFLPPTTVGSAAECAARCLGLDECISFNICGSAAPFACGVSTWSMAYDEASAPQCSWYRRTLPRDDSPAPRTVAYTAALPPPGAVTLAPAGVIGGTFARHADQYLRVRDPLDMLHFFASRAGAATIGTCYGGCTG